MDICFATNNVKKIEEIRHLMEPDFRIKSLAEIGCREELPETGETLEENSRQKAQYVWEHYGIACFADDTGLEVEALQGEPGVYSARYAGPERNNEANMALVLEKLKGEENRRARFRTVITWISERETLQFEGVVNGYILSAPRGERGFGYDPVFQPEGEKRSFAEMKIEEKNKISHRGKALEKFTHFIRTTKESPE